jgi:heat-inducible transcriptional repressor
MGEEKALYDSLLKKVLQVAAPAFAADAEASSVYVDGASNILGRTEFEDASRLRALFQTFEQKSRLVKIVTACLDGTGVRVVIGRQIPDPDLQGVALITSAVAVGAEGWALGVMGPTRMEYPHVVSVVDHMARVVSHALQELGK